MRRIRSEIDAFSRRGQFAEFPGHEYFDEQRDLKQSNTTQGRRLAPGQLRAHSPPQESKQAAGQKIVRNAIGAPPAACKENDPQLDRSSQSEAHKQAARCRREGLLSP